MRSGVVRHLRGIELAAGDRRGGVNRGVAAIGLDVHIDAVAVEQSAGETIAHLGLEVGLAEALRLPGHDQPAGIGDGGFQRLPGEEHDRGFQDREQQRQKWKRDQRELDGGGAVLVPRKASRDARRQKAAEEGSDLALNAPKHGNLRDG